MVDSGIARMVCCLLVVEHAGDSHSKVSSKGVDEHGAPDVCSLQHVDVEGLVGRIEHDLEEGDDDQLEGTGSTEHCPHCDQNCSCCKVTAHQTEGRERREIFIK